MSSKNKKYLPFKEIQGVLHDDPPISEANKNKIEILSKRLQ
ncbi:MAG TPA: hypothetical protein PKC21_06935 [Oligoflexia bacterium]|mgnify:CR=1 FL=1|nr:hypothetical protein [Oligoflexia bacterium]HMR25072.1 hypothetical protein [Oligoflexia bacterium]